MPKALVIGCYGQDGRYLSRLLLAKGYDVLGFDRHAVFGPAEWTGGVVDFAAADVTCSLLSGFSPDEVYYLAAYHHSSEDPPVNEHELVARSFDVNTLALNNVLHGIARGSPRSRLFYAASSRIFGEPSGDEQDEATPATPTCPYGISKSAGMQLCRYYRKALSVYASVGIMYNHESPLRPSRFVSKKIVGAAVRISRGSNQRLVVGDLHALVDWGFAPDFVRAMWQVLQLKDPDDFVIGTGALHSVLEFVQVAFGVLGIDWRPYVAEDPALLTRQAPNLTLRANTSKLCRMTGWRPRVSFEEMVARLVKAELDDADPTTNPDLYSDVQ